MASFAIEVAGEANPLTEKTLVHVLHSATSNDQIQVQTGAKQLQDWETSPGFFRHLQGVFIDYRLPSDIRYLSIIQLKNGIDKYWRRTARKSVITSLGILDFDVLTVEYSIVSDDDKQTIRSRLPASILNESDDKLALHNSLVIAKIARYEYPRAWPEAVSTFLTIVNASGNTQLQLARALLALLHIVKELSSARLQAGRQSLQSATPGIVAAAGNAYLRIVDDWTYRPNVEAIQLSLLAIKLVRRLLVFGYDYPHRDQHVQSFWRLSIRHLKSFIELRKTQGESMDREISRLLDQHVLQLAKLHHGMARDNPAAFALLPNSVDLVLAYWDLVKSYGEVIAAKDTVLLAFASATVSSDGNAEETAFDEKIALTGLLLIRACVRMVFQPAQTFRSRDTEAREERVKAIELIQSSLLSEMFICDVLETLTFKLFVLKPSDMHKWSEDPEEWEQREEGIGNDWEYTARPCAEKLFLDLSINYKNIVIGPMLAAASSVTGENKKDVQYRDSVYTAIGLASTVLHEHLNFGEFMKSALVPELRSSQTGANIIRRRIAIVLGQWVAQIPDGSKPLVYEFYQHLLNEDDDFNDQVVRVTAGRHFADVANDWEFQVEQFLPFAEKVLTSLIKLVRDSELAETKLAILNSVSIAVERLDHRVAPFAMEIISLLPTLWDDSESEHMMRQAILTVLARLVNAMRGTLLPLHEMVLTIISLALEPGSEENIYLLEDALEL